MKTSTNALTARYCAKMGWPCETVQSWRGKVRHDLFGIADSIILTRSRAHLIQNCSYGTLKAHRDAIDALPPTDRLFRSFKQQVLVTGLCINLWEWRKKKVGRKGLWFLRKQRHNAHGIWEPVGEWSEALDLYPTKTTKEKR